MLIVLMPRCQAVTRDLDFASYCIFFLNLKLLKLFEFALKFLKKIKSFAIVKIFESSIFEENNNWKSNEIEKRNRSVTLEKYSF